MIGEVALWVLLVVFAWLFGALVTAAILGRSNAFNLGSGRDRDVFVMACLMWPMVWCIWLAIFPFMLVKKLCLGIAESASRGR